MANRDSGHGLGLMAGGIKVKPVLKFKSPWSMRELGLGTFLPRDRGSKKPAVFLLLSPDDKFPLIAKRLGEMVVLKLEETSFMGKTSLWLCVCRQIGLNLTDCGGITPLIACVRVSENSVTTLTTESLSLLTREGTFSYR